MRPAAQGANHTPGFLAALQPLTRNEDFEITIECEEGWLKVHIEAAGYKPLTARGPASALDQELPGAIATYASWIDEQVAKDSSRAGAVEINLPGELETPKPARPARPKRVRRMAVARRKKPAALRPPAPKKAAPKRRTPAIKRRTPPPASRADKEACIVDYRVLKAKHGDKLTRRLFVDNARTGRRYEKLWGNSWPTFVKEAEAAAPATAKAESKPAAGAKPAAKKPEKAAKADKPAKVDKSPWAVKSGKAKLGATIFEKKPGDMINLGGSNYVVKSIDADKREIQVEATAPAPMPAVEQSTTAPPPAPKKPVAYAIQTAEGAKHGAVVTELAIGAKCGAGDRFEVTAIDHEKRIYTVKDLQAPAESKAAAEAGAGPASL